MIVLDTNIVSEVMKTAPSSRVIGWLNSKATSDLFVTTITVGEIEFGLRSLPAGRRRRLLRNKFEQFTARGFEGRVLLFDETAARAYGDIMTSRRERGRPISVPDGQIAAIARVSGFIIATRNTADFEDCGVDLVNPFGTGAP